MSKPVQPYTKPGPVGGRLIRQVISFMRSQGLELPISSHILIATSGGSDSVGLAHLLCRFGRRIIDPSRITLLHVNHGWRGLESDLDEAFVQQLGKEWGVPVISRKLKPPTLNSGKSWEEVARQARKKIFERESKKKQGALVFTGHQADDLAETVLWRLFTGAAETHGGGVAFSHGVEIRPFLKIRKSEIQDYLKEMGQSYREDVTNFSDRFLRSRMRSHLMPEAEKIFPRGVEHLVSLALNAQSQSKVSESDEESRVKSKEVVPEILLKAAGLRARRPHLELLKEKWIAKKPWYGEIHLPGGWKLVCEKASPNRRTRFRQNIEPPSERWILERI